MEIKQAIVVLEQAQAFFGAPETNEAFTLAIDALKEKAERESVKPLTMEQLLKMTGKPVYVVSTGRGTGRPFGEWCVMYNGDALIAGSGYTGWKKSTYRRNWLAYLSEPKGDKAE